MTLEFQGIDNVVNRQWLLFIDIDQNQWANEIDNNCPFIN